MEYREMPALLGAASPIDALRKHERIRLWCQRNSDIVRRIAGILEPIAPEGARAAGPQAVPAAA